MNNTGIYSAVIIIGNEILSGRTQDANLAYLGSRLSELGAPVLEVCVIPDVEQTIIETVNAYRKKFTYVFTTGGIGPTHDDITTACVAKAFNVPLRRNPEAFSALERYYTPGTLNEARLKMADIPEGAVLIENPVSAAPGFQLENVFVLPGIPQIMQVMFEGITNRISGGPPVLSHTIATRLREGDFAGPLTRIQEQYPDISIGSYPYFRAGTLGVNLVIRGTSQSRLDSAAEDIRQMISGLGGSLIND